MKYGFSYMGSKSKIAKNIIDILPSADNLYDLFAGGGAISHCALLSGKWKNIYSNDIQNTMSLFMDAVNGKYKNEKRWISREQFFKEKDKDHYIRWIWSFGNNGNSYIFGKDIENIKKEAHEFLFKNGYDYTTEKRIKLIAEFKEQNKKNGRFELEQLEQLERLERLQQLGRLERLQQLEISSLDYKNVKIKNNSIVYCDIPYKQKLTNKENYYSLSFDTNKFYEWALYNKNPVYFSSCFCENNNFEIVMNIQKQCLMNNKNSHNKKNIVEKLYWNGKGNKINNELFRGVQ